MSDKPPLLQAHHLYKKFPIYSGIIRHEVASVKAVSDVSFEIKEKEVVGLVGESGSGKSTIARIAAGLLEPTSGEIYFEGKNIQTLTPEEKSFFRRNTQMVFQDPYASLNPRKTISEAISEGIMLLKLAGNKEEARFLSLEALKKVGLSEEALDKYPHEFSGGQQQRICIGRSIALKPKLLISDESLSALDVSYQAQILNLFNDLKEELKLSYLFIAHDLELVKHISDKVIVLYLGKVMECASSVELFSNPKHPYTQALLSAVPKRHPSQEKNRILLEGEIPSPVHPPSGCPFRTRCPYAQKICEETPPKREVFDKGTKKMDHTYHCILP